jgi:hypothetical protein
MILQALSEFHDGRPDAEVARPAFGVETFGIQEIGIHQCREHQASPEGKCGLGVRAFRWPRRGTRNRVLFQASGKATCAGVFKQVLLGFQSGAEIFEIRQAAMMTGDDERQQRCTAVLGYQGTHRGMIHPITDVGFWVYPDSKLKARRYFPASCQRPAMLPHPGANDAAKPSARSAVEVR